MRSPGKREGFDADADEWPSPGVSLAQLNEVIAMNLDARVLTKGKLNSELSSPAGSPLRLSSQTGSPLRPATADGLTSDKPAGVSSALLGAARHRDAGDV